MGYNTTAATQTIAKLTPLGRQLLVTSNNTLITSFSLGDSDANYNALLPLTTGQIPAESGELLINGLQSNSTQVNTRIKSLLKFDTNGALQNQLNHNQVL
jgi:high-affinity K+ transport system ATPase subunit B